jgi:4-amino-4-deoxy-L-arabinose transferase-like glycosyltransferase
MEQSGTANGTTAYLVRLVAVMLAINLVFLAAILLGNPDTLLSPDSEGYLQIADWYRAGFPSESAPADFILLARPPLYPLLLWFSGASTGHFSTGIALNYGFAAAAVCGTFLLCRRWTSGKVAFVAALLLSLDPIFIKYTNKILTEIPFVALFVWSLIVLKPSAPLNRRAAVLCGALQAMAMMVRPILVFWPIVQVGAVLVIHARRADSCRLPHRKALVALSLYLGIVYAPALAWSIHNYRTQDYFGVSCIGIHNLVFYKAVRVLETAGVHEPEDYLVGQLETRDPDIMSKPFGQRTDAYKSVGLGVAMGYPVDSALAGMDSLRRILTQPSPPVFAERGSSLRLLYNLLKHISMLASFLLVMVVCYSLSRLARASRCWWNPLAWEHGAGVLVLVLAIAYFCLLSIPEGNARFRLPFLPFLYVLAATGYHLRQSQSAGRRLHGPS